MQARCKCSGAVSRLCLEPTPCPMARHCRRIASQPPLPACSSRCQGPPSLASCTCSLSLQQQIQALMMVHSVSISAVCKSLSCHTYATLTESLLPKGYMP